MNLTWLSTNICVRPILRKPALQQIPAHQCIYLSTRHQIWCLFCLLPCGSLRAVIDIYSQTLCHWLQYGIQALILSHTVISATLAQKPGILWSHKVLTPLNSTTLPCPKLSLSAAFGRDPMSTLLYSNRIPIPLFLCTYSELIECCLVLYLSELLYEVGSLCSVMLFIFTSPWGAYLEEHFLPYFTSFMFS